MPCAPSWTWYSLMQAMKAVLVPAANRTTHEKRFIAARRRRPRCHCKAGSVDSAPQ